jgi:hypothetical protein
VAGGAAGRRAGRGPVISSVDDLGDRAGAPAALAPAGPRLVPTTDRVGMRVPAPRIRQTNSATRLPIPGGAPLVR